MTHPRNLARIDRASRSPRPHQLLHPSGRPADIPCGYFGAAARIILSGRLAGAQGRGQPEDDDRRSEPGFGRWPRRISRDPNTPIWPPGFQDPGSRLAACFDRIRGVLGTAQESRESAGTQEFQSRDHDPFRCLHAAGSRYTPTRRQVLLATEIRSRFAARVPERLRAESSRTDTALRVDLRGQHASKLRRGVRAEPNSSPGFGNGSLPFANVGRTGIVCKSWLYRANRKHAMSGANLQQFSGRRVR